MEMISVSARTAKELAMLIDEQASQGYELHGQVISNTNVIAIERAGTKRRYFNEFTQFLVKNK
jgi:hypothetical protein